MGSGLFVGCLVGSLIVAMRWFVLPFQSAVVKNLMCVKRVEDRSCRFGCCWGKTAHCSDSL
jgi:hypothetical protein